MRAADYTTVVPQGSPDYLAPFDPSCPAAHRYMAVHRVSGGGWGIVDRRFGRLVAEPRPEQHRYPSWAAVQVAVHDLNAGGLD
jgi:hypothetical protein